MTIAACYLSSEGVVFGADSTTTMYVPCPDPNAMGRDHHFNHAQKIFQLGSDSTLGITLWGLGNVGAASYRTLVAEFADTIAAHEASSVEEVAIRWNRAFWARYSQCYASALSRVQALLAADERTLEEEAEVDDAIQRLSGGFCLGGNLAHDRTPRAYEILFGPQWTAPQPPRQLPPGSTFWGCPNMIERLLLGLDRGLYQQILTCGRWNGTSEDLIGLLRPGMLGQPQDLPIRDAIDWVHASIYTTIKTFKFSHFAPVCGGPVEIAVITADRPFRWVRHKRFDAAIADGGQLHV
jgi:hypothetical protein